MMIQTPKKETRKIQNIDERQNFFRAAFTAVMEDSHRIFSDELCYDLEDQDFDFEEFEDDIDCPGLD